jgi:hypothetical protein
MNRERKTSSGTREASQSGDCDRHHGCETCKDNNREYGAAGERIVSWGKAIELLVDQARAGGEDAPSIFDAIDGLAFAIETVADQDIVSVSLAPDDREVPLGGRYQGPRVLSAS